MNVLLIGGVETRFHRFEEVTPPLERLVTSRGHVATRLRAPDALDATLLERFDAIVSITTGGQLDQRQEAALLHAVSERRNHLGNAVHFLGLHGASCSFEDSNAYYEMLGGRFLTHPKIAAFEVHIDREHPVTAGIAPFTIDDELYVLELCSKVDVLLHAKKPAGVPDLSGDSLPLGWVRHFGAGKVCYLALGHGPEQLAHPSLGQLIVQALDWFCH